MIFTEEATFCKFGRTRTDFSKVAIRVRILISVKLFIAMISSIYCSKTEFAYLLEEPGQIIYVIQPYTQKSAKIVNPFKG